jgi:cytochrome c-type biogenesis protein CcmE
VTVVYRGTVPDTFKPGREIVVTGALQGDTFVAKRNSLVALCPSKFTDKPEQTMGQARAQGHPESVPLN